MLPLHQNIPIDSSGKAAPSSSTHKSWGPGDNPKMAVWEYLKTHPEFEIDTSVQHKLLITVAPDGYLKRLR